MIRRGWLGGALLALAAAVAWRLLPGPIWQYGLRLGLFFVAASLVCLLFAGRAAPRAGAWPQHAETGDFAGVDVVWRPLVPGYWEVQAIAPASALRLRRWFSPGTRRVRLEERVARRGIHNYQVMLTYRDPLGFFARRLRLHGEVELVVYPRTVPLRRLGTLRADRGALVGPRRVQRAEAPSGVRRYLPGDRLAEVHWPQTMRTGEVQVRDAYAHGTSERTIVLDTRQSAYPDEQSFELAVSVAASLALSIARRGDPVSLAAGDTLLTARLATPARILDVLTRVRFGDGGDSLAASARQMVYVGGAQGVASVRSQRPAAFAVAVGRGAVGADLAIPDWPSLQRLSRGAGARR